MNAPLRLLLSAVYLTGTLFGPVLHLAFHDREHEHPGDTVHSHSRRGLEDHSHPHEHSHPHPEGHPADHSTPLPEHGSGSAAHFDAALSDDAARDLTLELCERASPFLAFEKPDVLESIELTRIDARGPPSFVTLFSFT